VPWESLTIYPRTLLMIWQDGRVGLNSFRLFSTYKNSLLECWAKRSLESGSVEAKRAVK